MKQTGLSYDDVLLIPNYSEIKSRLNVDLKTKLSKNISIELPFISANMDTITEYDMAKKLDEYGALGVIHRFSPIQYECDIIKRLKNKGVKILAASIGVSGENKKRLEALVTVGANVICIDIAHGHHKLMADTIRLCKKYPVDIIAGNIATPEAAEFLCKNGADAVKVGIGPGSMCTTRVNTGFGIPQISAIEDILKVTQKYDVPIIADGGIKNSGDVAKALAVGANSVMMGSLFAGTKEAPGMIHKEGNFPNYTLYKRYRGSASLDSKLAHGRQKRNVEGISTTVEYKGPVKYVIRNLEDGLRSAFSYAGANNIKEFHDQVDYVKLSSPEREI